MTVLPVFQPQNPAISGYRYGWISCSAFSAAMAGSFDTLGAKTPTGGQVRNLTGDFTGGLTLAQVDASLNKGWDIDLSTNYRMPWSDFAKKIMAGCGAVLQGWYAPIADSRYDAGGGFRGNHAIFVAPGFVAMDPLADGRRAGIYKYHGEAYPVGLLQSFAGQLNLGGGSRLGAGLVYAAFTRDNVHTYQLDFLGGNFYRYFLDAAKENIVRRSPVLGSATDKPAPVSAPAHYPWPNHAGRVLVRILDGKYQGIWVAVPQSQLKLELVP